MREPQEIEDEEHEQILQRVAAVDVAKASGMVCTRMPYEARPGRRRTRVWGVDATANAVMELAGYLAAERVERVTLEATSDYWRIWFYLLEVVGLDVQLVQCPGSEGRARAPRDRQTGCGVAGEADRAGDAAAILCASGRDSPAA